MISSLNIGADLILFRAYVVYSGGSYYRHLRGVLIEDFITFRQDSRLRDYGNDGVEPCKSQAAVIIVIFEVF